MRILVIALAVLTVVLSANNVRCDEVKVGDSVELVRDVMGPPEGYIKSGTYELLVYDRGRIEAREGIVTKAELVTEEQAAAARAEKERVRLARLEAERVRREQRMRQGERVRDVMLADPVFLASPAGDQLAYWQRFAKDYPGVQVDEDYRAGLTARHMQELKDAETEQRLRAMENRVAAAEARAERAEKDAADAQRRSRSYVDYGYPRVRYGTPIYVTPTPYCTHSHSRSRTPARTTTHRTTVGPISGRTIFTPNKPYVYSPSTSWRNNRSILETRESGLQVRAKVDF